MDDPSHGTPLTPAWLAFEEGLVQALSRMRSGQALIIGEDSARASYVEVRLDDGGAIVECSSNALRTGDAVPPHEQVAAVRRLGYALPPNKGRPPKLHRSFEPPAPLPGVARLVIGTVSTMFGVPHPVVLHLKLIAARRDAAPLPDLSDLAILARYRFWDGGIRGLIRQRSGPGWQAYPEIWHDGGWVKGSAYIVDAISGMGEDAYSCGSWADDLTLKQAEAMAAEKGIDLNGPAGL